MSTAAQERAWDSKALARPGESLADLRPDLAERAVANLSRPSVAPARLRLRSAATVLWKCQCGVAFKATVNNATKTQVFVCRTCQRRGKSRFEFQVAEVLRVLTGASISMHHGEHRATAVDLYLPALDAAVQLDPVSSHTNKTEADARRLRALQDTYTVVVRVREEPLPPIPGCISVPKRSSVAVWATKSAEALGLPVRPATAEVLTAALERAAAEWQSVLTARPSPSLVDHPPLAEEFVANVTHPGREPEWIPAGAGDIATWRCSVCGNIWNAQVAHRTGPNPTGCPPCGIRRRTAASAVAPRGQRIEDLAPLLIAEFVENLDLPGAAIETAFARSKHRCLWRCTYCNRAWTAAIQARFKHSHTGCLRCNLQRAWDTGVRVVPARYDAQWDAGFAVLSAFTERTGDACPFVEHVEDGFALGAWVRTQRRRRAELSEARRDRLEALPGWVWNARDEAWERGFATLAAYVARTGHANVPYRHSEDGYRLGGWVVTQRQARARLTAAQIRRLESLDGWVWAGVKTRGR